MSDCAQCLAAIIFPRRQHPPLRQDYHGPDMVDGSALFAVLFSFSSLVSASLSGPCCLHFTAFVASCFVAHHRRTPANASRAPIATASTLFPLPAEARTAA
jgi:hypothetical protein